MTFRVDEKSNHVVVTVETPFGVKRVVVTGSRVCVSHVNATSISDLKKIFDLDNEERIPQENGKLPTVTKERVVVASNVENGTLSSFEISKFEA